MQKLPIGMEFLDSLREGNFLYVDKTEHIHRLINTGTFVFLSRPRRFGKSLLVSTLQHLFQGHKQFFFSGVVGSKTRSTGSRARCW